MTDTNNPSSEPTFSDDDAKNILRRAAEIEKEGHISASRLREIAGEAQISEDAMDRALAEATAEKQLQQHAQNTVQPAAPQSYLSWQGWLLVAAIVLAAIIAVVRL